LTAVAVAAPAVAAPALPPLDPVKLHDAIDPLPAGKVTGALAQIRGSAGEWTGTSGVEDVRTGAPVQPGDRFRIGSMTKVFTATVVLQLAAEHRVDLDEDVQRYLPGVLPAHLPKVKVRQLLNHTSGLPNDLSPEFPPSPGPAWFVAHRFDVWTPQQIVQISTRHEQQFDPGSKQQYEGINYYLAGMLIERVTGHSYADEVRCRIIDRLRLRGTSVPDIADPAIPGPHTHGYVAIPGEAELADVTEQSPWAWAEGGMISTAPDLDTFLVALFKGRLLPPAQLDEMFRVPDVEYAGTDNCNRGPGAGKACFSAGLTTGTLPSGVTVWGKTGARPGYTSGMFATRDLARRAVYSFNPTNNKDGSDLPFVLRLASAAF
jgi:D-alanyl-D-alanine carboxypeptidase